MEGHWSRLTEYKGYAGLRVILFLLRVLPGFCVRLVVFPVTVCYYIFVRRARRESARFLQKAAGVLRGEGKKISISPFRHIFSFALSLVEKLESWGGKANAARLHYQDDDVKDLTRRLDKGEGVLFICSHLGNAEFLHGVTTVDHTVVARQVPVTSIADVNVNSGFNRALRDANPASLMNIISAGSIGPDTIIRLQDRIEEGGIVVIAGDRTSANTRGKYFRFPFLGEEALFSFGPFFLAALLDAPTYFVFALRRKDISFAPEYDVHIHKSAISFNCPRGERDARVRELARAFAGRLEYHCKKHPYQWYNFFDFWAKEEPEKNEPA